MENLKEEYERIKENARRIRTTRDIYDQMVNFYEELLYLQLKQKNRVNLETPEIPPEIVATKMKEGFPLLNREDFPVDFDAALKLLKNIRNIIPGENKELCETHNRLLGFLESSDPREKFWKHLLSGDEKALKKVAKEINSPLQQIIFLGLSAIKPSVWFVRSEVECLLSAESGWRRNYCPVCGSLPSILLLKEKEGKKYGSCSWCDKQWLMNRIECPYCLNQLQESLGYIAIEDDEVYRVEYCDVCKYYFKLVDCRPLEVEPVPPLEEFTTLHLDMIAQNKGYKMPPALSPALYGESPDK